MSITKGWNRGLREGLEGSGLFAGFIVPITITVILIVGLIMGAVWVYGCVNEPGTCTNYTYSMGILDSKSAQCTRWPAMEMRIEKRYVKGNLVHCKCSAESK